MEVIYRENILTADDVLLFQQKMNWTVDPKEQWVKSLSNTLYSIVAVKDNEIIGMGRLLGDAAIYWYVNDLFILTEYQGKGIGTEIMNRLIEYIKQNSIVGTSISVCLMCAQGKEGLYEKLGFKCRPHDYEGSGMELELNIN